MITRLRVKQREGQVGTYGLEGVIRAWEMEKLTTEQAIGQILQLIAEIEERLGDLERKYSRLNRISSSSTPPIRSQDSEAEEGEA
jgi:hypothetical protein